MPESGFWSANCFIRRGRRTLKIPDAEEQVAFDAVMDALRQLDDIQSEVAGTALSTPGETWCLTGVYEKYIFSWEFLMQIERMDDCGKSTPSSDLQNSLSPLHLAVAVWERELEGALNRARCRPISYFGLPNGGPLTHHRRSLNRWDRRKAVVPYFLSLKEVDQCRDPASGQRASLSHQHFVVIQPY
jgi:hypothetical protein